LIDVKKLKYQFIGISEDGTQLDITGATEDQGWEEGEGELAMRVSLTVHNTKYNGKYLSDILKPGCIIAVVADWGDGTEEVARGSIVDWDTSNQSSKDTFSILAYDELFNLQDSQDNRYITAGTGTKAALTAIFSDWGIPVGEYKGPDVPHAKTPFKNEYISDMIEQLLDDAVKQGAEKCIIRASKGTVSVLPEGGNDTIYHFDEDGSIEVTKDKVSIQGLITRVKVVGKEDSEGRQAVEAIVDGQTRFGTRQRIYNRQENDSLATAKAAAQKIISDSEADTRSTTIQGPDVPTIRKGDKIHVTGRTLDGYYIVLSVQHNAASCSMTMGIKPFEETPKQPEQAQEPASTDFNKGDKVILNGAVYRDSYGTGKGKTFSGRTCTITIKVDTSRPCPYHVDGIGWVYPNTITKA
jgi:hypothetical protein